MSTFKGFLVDPELNFIAIDHFGKHVYNCDVFLLSHHHCDHMKGVYSKELGKLINESPTKTVYCSLVTAHFLRKNRSCHIRDDKIVQLEVNKAFPIAVRHETVQTHVNVTCLPAAHCPGSVMFLIEYNNKRILYSGDIRLTLSDMKNIIGTITNMDGSPIAIDDMYLDTTFAVPTRLENFPSREESERAIIDFINQLVSASPKRKIVLNIRANFGYETLYVRLYKIYKKPIVLHNHMMVYYENIEEFRDYVCGEYQCNDDWLIHACLDIKKCKLVNVTEDVKVLKPCVLGFVKDSDKDIKLHNNVPYDKRSYITKVFYSTHCSLNELRAIYSFLRPKRLFPSVISDNRTIKEIIAIIGAASEDRTEVGLRAIPSRPKRNRKEHERRLEKRKQLKLDV